MKESIHIMIYIVGVIVFLLAFVSMYCAAISNLSWFRVTIYTLLSVVFAIIVTANFR